MACHFQHFTVLRHGYPFFKQFRCLLPVLVCFFCTHSDDQFAAWPAGADTCVLGCRSTPRTSKPAARLPLLGLRGRRRDLISHGGSALPDPQLHRGLGQGQLELLVLHPQPALLGCSRPTSAPTGHFFHPGRTGFEELMLPLGHQVRRHPAPAGRLSTRHFPGQHGQHQMCLLLSGDLRSSRSDHAPLNLLNDGPVVDNAALPQSLSQCRRL